MLWLDRSNPPALPQDRVGEQGTQDDNRSVPANLLASPIRCVPGMPPHWTWEERWAQHRPLTGASGGEGPTGLRAEPPATHILSPLPSHPLVTSLNHLRDSSILK